MVFETLGYWTEEVTKLINNCCQIIAEKEGVSSAQLSQYWIMKLSFTLQWENAITIAERIDYSMKLDDTQTGRRSKHKDFRRILTKPK
jgi:hypothetical protein